MAYFIEERLAACILYEQSWGDDYAVEIVESGGADNIRASEYRKLSHPFPRRKFNVGYQLERDDLFKQVMSLYHRCYGKFAGFRFKCMDDFTTAADHRSVPGINDYTLKLISTGVYQLVKYYGHQDSPIGISWPPRYLYKPVAGTVRVAVAGVEVPASLFTVDTTTGRVTFINKSKAITNITKAANAVVTVGAGHGYTANTSVYFAGVAGMTEINGLRGTIISVAASTITVNINSTSFTAYTSGGTVNTGVLSGDSVTGGCEFDFPVRFNSEYTIRANHPTSRRVEFELIELLNL